MVWERCSKCQQPFEQLQGEPICAACAGAFFRLLRGERSVVVGSGLPQHDERGKTLNNSRRVWEARRAKAHGQ
jgi:hypothetical protein